MHAGLGGGSSDAAHTLRLLNTIFELKLSREKMFQLAASLGSDCSFFVQDEPMIGSGRGDVLTPANLELSGKSIVLLNPGVHVSTAEAYAGIVPSQPANALDWILQQPLREWKSLLKNDFERSVFETFPIIAELKAMLYDSGAAYAAMSGSGSSVFGIFDSEIPQLLQYEKYVVWKGVL